MYLYLRCVVQKKIFLCFCKVIECFFIEILWKFWILEESNFWKVIYNIGSENLKGIINFELCVYILRGDEVQEFGDIFEL